MLSYQHAYHAGNHADILKHYVLTFVLNSLNKKDKSYTFYDTHSGSGLYDLLDNRSLKTGEAESGIKYFIRCLNEEKIKTDLGDSFSLYLKTVEKYLGKDLYPGSPMIENELIRNNDFLILSELHPQEIENLRKNLKNTKSQIHFRDGFEMLKAMTPPKTGRGAVLIDPSYEESIDYEKVAKTVCQINKKWSNGIIMVWYPLLAHRQYEIDKMINEITNGCHAVNQNTEIKNITLCINNKDSHKETTLEEVLSDENKKNPPRLYGSGMLVINAPWHLAEEANNVVDFITSFYR